MTDRQQQADKLKATAEWFRDCKTLTLEKMPHGLIAALEAGASALAREQEMQKLLIRADSLLSLLWHRHVPSDRKDSYLSRDVEQTIGDLRRESKVPHD